MRALAQPEVLKSAALASLATALACYPRLGNAPQLRYPLWYLLSLIFLGGIVLWAFVFAWHRRYSGRPLSAARFNLLLWAAMTFLGIGTALALVKYVDPTLRLRSPQDYPVSFEQWLQMALFNLTFTQLFLVFSPFAWLLRLFRSVRVAAVLTVLFGLLVMALKNRSPSVPMPPLLLLELVVFRIFSGAISIFMLLRGGMPLVWWWALLLQSRHLVVLLAAS